MATMKSRILISFLLIAALWIPFLSIPYGSSQSGAVTTTMTISQPPSGQCTEISLAFSAQKGKEIAGTFGSAVSVSFYILSQKDFNAIQNPNCRLPTSATPLYIVVNQVGHGNQYRSLPFSANGTYYFVFAYANNGIIIPNGSATVELSFPPSTTLVSTVASATTSSSSPIVTASQSTSCNRYGDSKHEFNRYGDSKHEPNRYGDSKHASCLHHPILRNFRSNRVNCCDWPGRFSVGFHEAGEVADSTEKCTETGDRKERNKVRRPRAGHYPSRAKHLHRV